LFGNVFTKTVTLNTGIHIEKFVVENENIYHNGVKTYISLSSLILNSNVFTISIPHSFSNSLTEKWRERREELKFDLEHQKNSPQHAI